MHKSTRVYLFSPIILLLFLLIISWFVKSQTVQLEKAPSVEHVIVVIEENHSYQQIVESHTKPNDADPYLQSLIRQGALFTNAHGITHPSQPNYLALFSGSTQHIQSDACNKPMNAPNLADSLIAAGLTFTGYSENLPYAGFTGCSSHGYARKHNPWVQFTNIAAKLNQPLSAFPDRLDMLPTVSFVIPSLENDMHDGTVMQSDNWLKAHLDNYVKWSEKHNSLLIVTWDEDDFTTANQIPLILVGPMIKQGKYADNVTHYDVLRTIEDIYHLSPIGNSKSAKALTKAFK